VWFFAHTSPQSSPNVVPVTLTKEATHNFWTGLGDSSAWREFQTVGAIIQI
jgi:hypothetical protein